MPLRTEGRKITPRKPPPRETELSLPYKTPAALPAGLKTAGKRSPVSGERLRRFPQLRREWCWAACAQMVANYYQFDGADDLNGFQCKLAKILLRDKGCRTGDCNSDECNLPCSAGEVAQLYEQLGITASRRGEAIGFREVAGEIDEGRPVEVGLEWSGGGRHLVVIYGWSPSDEPDDGFIKVNDPLDDHQPNGEIRHSELLAAYGEGQWIDTWTDLRMSRSTTASPTAKPSTPSCSPPRAKAG